MHQKCAKAVPKTRPNQRNDTGTVPLEARGVQRREKAGQNSPKTSPKGCQEGAMAAKSGQNGAKKRARIHSKLNFWASYAQGLILTSFLSNSEAIYAINNPKISLKSKKNCVCSEAASKMKNCVWTAPARADRGSDPPEKLKKH